MGEVMNIIELAEQAGFVLIPQTNDDWVCFSEEIETFAALVEAQEREECWRTAENYDTGYEAAQAIRARGTK